MNRYQFKGRISQATGKVKELTGRLFGNRSLEGRGLAQKTGGKIKAGYGDVKDDARKHV